MVLRSDVGLMTDRTVRSAFRPRERALHECLIIIIIIIIISIIIINVFSRINCFLHSPTTGAIPWS